MLSPSTTRYTLTLLHSGQAPSTEKSCRTSSQPIVKFRPETSDCVRTSDNADVAALEYDFLLVGRSNLRDQVLGRLIGSDMIVLRHGVQDRYLDVREIDFAAADDELVVIELVLPKQVLDHLPEILARERQRVSSPS